MRRIALALAATVLGSGCVVTDSSPGSGDLNLYWEFVRTRADGSIVVPHYDPVDAAQSGTGACPQAGVDYVLIFSPYSTLPVQWECRVQGVQGVTILDMPTGTYDLRVVGYRIDSAYTDDIAVYDSDVTVTVRDGTTSTATAEVFGRYKPLDVFPELRSANGSAAFADCTAAAVTEIDYTLTDGANTLVASGTIPCADPVIPRAAFADLDLDVYAVRFRAFGSSMTVPDFDTQSPFFSCGLTRIDHYGIDLAWSVPAYDVLGYAANELCP